MTMVAENENSVVEQCKKIQGVGRQRAWFLKSRMMLTNRIVAAVAVQKNYDSHDTPKEREKAFADARDVIKKIRKGEFDGDDEILGYVVPAYMAIDQLEKEKCLLEKQMVAVVKEMDIAKWVGEEEQRGFGLPMLAVVLAETGDLANYSLPGKVWRRMGCAPFEKDGENWMGSTWRKKPKKDKVRLSSEDWEEFGYNPRRRSVSYLIGESLLKANKGVYRRRYDESKAALKQKHEDYTDLRCHNHAKLLMTKLLLKNLWMAWNPAKVWK